MRIILALAAIVLVARPISAQNDTDGERVLAVVQQFFDTMRSRDVEGAKRTMLPEGRMFSTRDENGTIAVRSQTHQQYFDSLAKGKVAQLERMWKPDVRIHGSIAIVWTPYDFHRDGTFSHCGVDAFTLVRTGDGWRISGGAYTVERTGCAPSPLGAPKNPRP